MPINADEIIQRAFDKGIDIGANAAQGWIDRTFSAGQSRQEQAKNPLPPPTPPIPSPAPSAVNQPSWQLRVLKSPGGSQSFRIDRLPLVIGRDAAYSNWVIPDTSVSHRHAEIFAYDGKLWIKDLGSTNHTIVNGQIVTSAELEPGDTITLGSTVIQIVYA